MDQLVLDVLPDDPGHLVAIEFDDGVGHLDFCHDGSGLFGKQRVSGRMGWWCRRYSTRKRGLEGEWRGRSRLVFRPRPETPFQPASCLARRHGADHRGGVAGILPVLDFGDVQIEPGGTPAAVRMAKLQNSAPHRVRHGRGPPRSRRATESRAQRPAMRGAQSRGASSRHFFSSRSAKTSRPCLSATRIGHAITATVP